MHVRAALSLVALLSAWAPPAGADGNKPPSGTWQGGGRACAGKLEITAHTVSWRTPFSRCAGLPFEFSDMGDAHGIGRSVFTLQRAVNGCPFASIELLRKPGATARPGQERWEVIGHRSEADRRAGRLDEALACPVVRLK